MVLVAPSTAQDREHRLLRAALEGLADRPSAGARHDATAGSRSRRSRCPPNAALVDWLSYAKTMPHCDAVLTHAGHGTVCARSPRAAGGRRPAAGDMNENAARVAWAGVGVRSRAASSAREPSGWAVGRALENPALRAGARDVARLARDHDPGARAVELLERFAAR